MCIFCKIVAGEIPAYTIYEDASVLAFLDISQVTKGHTLVIPKTHVPNIYAMRPDVAEGVFKALPNVASAIKDAFNPIGLNLINNNDQPLQSVFHLHFHLLPRYPDDGIHIGLEKATPNISKDTYEAIQSDIIQHLKNES